MTVHRRSAALIVIALLLVLAVPALAAGPPPSRLSQTAPSWLRPVAATKVQLPRTGFDLMPEVLAGAALVVAGLGLRVALRIHRA